MSKNKSLRQRLHGAVDSVCDKAHDAKVKVQIARRERAKKVLEATAEYADQTVVEAEKAKKLTWRERLFGRVISE